jgi:para-nitrobenzyl esterase
VVKGIPYASLPDPCGPPGPAGPWNGDGLEFGPPPPQYGLSGPSAAAPGEWLTVNVWTPDPAARLPVLVWIQGGGYMFGTSGRPEYDGARLAGDGVVVVTFNYRVGVEGFAYVEGAPPNRGLLDQVAALEWVRDNIAGFGGDPASVTVFGQSAGAGCVAALLAMPAAAGLFHRAIVQSMPGTYFTPELAADIAGRLGADENEPRWGLAARRRVLLGPVVDGDVLPADPWTALAGGAARDVDLVVGHTRHEHRLFMLLDGTLGRVTPAQAAEAVELFAPGPYEGTPEEVYERVHSDWLFRMPSLHLAEAHLGRTWAYELTWAAPMLGACHGLDVPLVFGNLTDNEPAQLLGADLAAASAVSDQMRSAWIAFAVSGDPGWAPWGPDRPTRLFDTAPAVVPYPEEASRLLWQDHRFDPLPLLRTAEARRIRDSNP